MTNVVKYCECGCGQIVNRRFVLGHHLKEKITKPERYKINLCQCGCGEYTKPRRRYILNHHSKGKPAHNRGSKHTKESLKKMSDGLRNFYDEGGVPWNKGTKGLTSGWNKGLTKETDKRVAASAAKLSESKKGSIPWNKDAKGDPNYPLRGRKRDSDIIARTVKTRMDNGYSHSEETKKKISKAHKGKVISEDQKIKLSKVLTGRKFTEEHKAKIGKAHKGMKRSDETKAKMSAFQKGKIVSDETKEKTRQTMLNKFKYDEQYLSNWIKGCKSTPNKLEVFVDSVLQDLFPGEWKFVGNFDTFIGGKCPDFFNVNGQKKLIEVFGDYWHKDDNPKNRINHFKQYGFDTLVIWEDAINNNLEEVKSVISNFTGKE